MLITALTCHTLVDQLFRMPDVELVVSHRTDGFLDESRAIKCVKLTRTLGVNLNIRIQSFSYIYMEWHGNSPLYY